MWVAAKFMLALLIGVFVFFWTHTALWFYREWRDRERARAAPTSGRRQPAAEGKQYQRFGPWWRLAHLVFALSVMTLVLTGMAVFFAETAWAKAVIRALGGAQTAAIIHRAAAATMLGIFFIHLVYVVGVRIIANWKTFRWFGPNSLVPTWQDVKDIIAMFQWFFGRRPRPQFDRWTYWEKFDYWAVFWGMAIIGGSGFMLASRRSPLRCCPAGCSTSRRWCTARRRCSPRCSSSRCTSSTTTSGRTSSRSTR